MCAVSKDIYVIISYSFSIFLNLYKLILNNIIYWIAITYQYSVTPIFKMLQRQISFHFKGYVSNNIFLHYVDQEYFIYYLFHHLHFIYI